MSCQLPERFAVFWDVLLVGIEDKNIGLWNTSLLCCLLCCLERRQPGDEKFCLADAQVMHHLRDFVAGIGASEDAAGSHDAQI